MNRIPCSLLARATGSILHALLENDPESPLCVFPRSGLSFGRQLDYDFG